AVGAGDVGAAPAAGGGVGGEVRAVVGHAVAVDGLQEAAEVDDDAAVLVLMVQLDASGLRGACGGAQGVRALFAGGELGDVPARARLALERVELGGGGFAGRVVDAFPIAVDVRVGGQFGFGDEVGSRGDRGAELDLGHATGADCFDTGGRAKPGGGIWE